MNMSRWIGLQLMDNDLFYSGAYNRIDFQINVGSTNRASGITLPKSLTLIVDDITGHAWSKYVPRVEPWSTTNVSYILKEVQCRHRHTSFRHAAASFHTYSPRWLDLAIKFLLHDEHICNQVTGIGGADMSDYFCFVRANMFKKSSLLDLMHL